MLFRFSCTFLKRWRTFYHNNWDRQISSYFTHIRSNFYVQITSNKENHANIIRVYLTKGICYTAFYKIFVTINFWHLIHRFTQNLIYLMLEAQFIHLVQSAAKIGAETLRLFLRSPRSNFLKIDLDFLEWFLKCFRGF